MSTPVVLMNDQEIEQLSAEQRSGFGSLESERGLFPLQALSVRAAIDGLLADVEVCQTFVNVFKKPLEATYIFPLPDRAAVSSFVMKVAGRRIEGELKERELARLDYEKAIQKGYRAAITEEERPNVFSLRVGNIQAGEKAVVRFRMAMPLLFSDGEVTFRFPLVVAPRYIPGIPLPMENVGLGTAWDTDIVPDASRISPPVLLPGFPNPVRLNIQVDLNPAGLPLSDLRASLHNVCVNKMDNGVLRIRLEPGERLNRDFILRYRLGDDAVRTSLLLQPDETNADEGTFTLTLVPPANKSEVRKPRDLVFLLDRSGSMAGWKIVAARRALAAIIDTLSEEDRFNILAFDNTVEVPPGFKLQGLQTATNANRSRSMEWLSTIQARGGTEIYQALNVALTFLTSYPAPREQVLVVITDGQVGDESRILAMLGDRLASVRVFALGIDQAVNEGFLRRMAQLGGGSCEMVESEARLNEVMARIHRYLTIPVITGLQISGEKLDFDQASVTPRRLPDLFAGTPVVIAGRYRGQPAGNITVRGQLPDGSSWQTTAVGATTLNPVHVKTWARNRLRDLEDLYESGAESYLTLEEEILQTSLRFGVLCRFTAFVAVDRSEVVNGDGQPIQFIQPVEAP
ncbi:MAG: VIT domain-containing protein, partial [Gemmatales bacterium]|nr:VIT domain-containing protein [Gemmatales bacterium]MDW8388118.1 VIT domain-containing protein [Gemmatales bacterium]